VETEAELRSQLRRIEGRGYKAYKDLRGAYRVGSFELHLDHVQADPFATPSRVRVRLAAAEARIPPELLASRVLRVALADYLARRVRTAVRDGGASRRGSGKSGVVSIDAGAQEVLERTAVRLHDDFVEVRLWVGLPAAGRTVLGREAADLLCKDLPLIAERSLCFDRLPEGSAERFVACVENQEHLRARLAELGLVAFVAEGSILPRESGASDRPLRHGAKPFQGPDSLRVEVALPNPTDPGDPSSRTVAGTGIPRGVTLVVGGGYHGKSTLLRALERGVYPHVPGDGRELVVTDSAAVKIRAEDGRRVDHCDIHAFIGELPYGRDTRSFCSEEASGSTSQAANIVEALELGARVLLLDEDTSATNFMVRDARMQALVRKENEPITPFLDRVRELYEEHGVSAVIVMGGCGDYFDVADTVIEMRGFAAHEVTAAAREVAACHATQRAPEHEQRFEGVTQRIPVARSLDASRGRRELQIDVRSADAIRFGSQDVDLRAVEQLLDPSQTRAAAYAIHLARERLIGPDTSLREVMEELEQIFDEEGLDVLDPFRRPQGHPGDFARPRRFEIAAALNRLRNAKFRQREREGS
jgi:predicted ABC-class ATPase